MLHCMKTAAAIPIKLDVIPGAAAVAAATAAAIAAAVAAALASRDRRAATTNKEQPTRSVLGNVPMVRGNPRRPWNRYQSVPVPVPMVGSHRSQQKISHSNLNTT